jgi:hypothetical protein
VNERVCGGAVTTDLSAGAVGGGDVRENDHDEGGVYGGRYGNAYDEAEEEQRKCSVCARVVSKMGVRHSCTCAEPARSLRATLRVASRPCRAMSHR